MQTTGGQAEAVFLVAAEAQRPVSLVAAAVLQQVFLESDVMEPWVLRGQVSRVASPASVEVWLQGDTVRTRRCRMYDQHTDLDHLLQASILAYLQQTTLPVAAALHPLAEQQARGLTLPTIAHHHLLLELLRLSRHPLRVHYDHSSRLSLASFPPESASVALRTPLPA